MIDMQSWWHLYDSGGNDGGDVRLKGRKCLNQPLPAYSQLTLTWQLFVYFSSSSKYFFLSFEVNFTIFTAILSEQERAIIAFKKNV